MTALDVTRRFHRRTAWLYEPLRQFFAGREGRHQGLREDLNAARMSVTLTDYLARSAVVAAFAAAMGVAVGLLVTAWLVTSATIAAVPVVGAWPASVRALLVAVGLAVPLGATAGLAAWYVRYYLPRRRAAARARRLSLLYPPGVTYMYALSQGGLDVVEILRRLSRSEDTYGELAREAGLVVNQMDYLGRDFMQALQETAQVTPSSELSDFFGDLLDVVESGGSVEDFLADQRETAVTQTRSVQASYVDTVELFAEVYVTLLVAGPLFALVLLMVIGITGADTLAQVNLVVYVLVPGASLAALFVLDRLGSPFRQTATTQSDSVADRPTVPDVPEARDYAERKRRFEWRDRLRNPVELLRRRPTRVLWLSIPLALSSVGALVLAGAVSPSPGALRAAPVRASALLFGVPFVVGLAPLAVAQEFRHRRLDAVNDRFPDVLASVASANRMGIRPAEAVELATDRADDYLSAELTRVHNETRWFDDFRGSLLRMAGRAQTRIVTRTLRLVAEADEASGNLAATLSVAAEDARTQRDLARERARELSTYVAAAVISFLVYVGILLLINEFYFEQAVAIGQQSGPSNPALPVSLQSIDADGFRVAFVHSSLVQALFVGLVAGKLSTGRALSGLKYSIGMVVLTFVAFGVV